MIFLYHLSLVIFYIYFQMTRKRPIKSLLKYVESKKPRSGEANILSVFSRGLGLGDGIGFLILTYLLNCRGEINCCFIESQSYLFITFPQGVFLTLPLYGECAGPFFELSHNTWLCNSTLILLLIWTMECWIPKPNMVSSLLLELQTWGNVERCGKYIKQ